MEKYIIGKFKKIIYENKESNFVVTLFKVEDTDDTFIKENMASLIHVTGILPNIRLDVKYKVYGNTINHPKYSWQFSGYRLSTVMPTTEEEIIKFLESPFVEGCSKVFAKRIVDTYGVNSIKIIKEDINNLFSIKGMTTLKASKIYGSLIKYEKDDEIIKKLTSYGFSYEQAAKAINKHYTDITPIIEGNLYLMKDIFDFKFLDDLYKRNISKDDNLR